MEVLIIALVVVGAIIWWIWKEGKLEQSGHPLETITKKLDVNNDGKINKDDAVEAVEVVKKKTTRKKKTTDQESA